MADTTALKNRIRAAIKANDNQEITGPVLQQSLLDIIDELDLNPELQNEIQQRQTADTQLNNLITGIKNNIDDGYVLAGVAELSTQPLSSIKRLFYIAFDKGVYSYFFQNGDIPVEIEKEGIHLFIAGGEADDWRIETLFEVDDKPLPESNNLVDSNGIIDETVLDKLKFNVRSILESSQETDKELLDLCLDVIYNNNMKAFGLNQLVSLYINWKDQNQEENGGEQ